MGGIDCRLANFFDICRVTKRCEGMAIEQFENLRLPAPDAERENAIVQFHRERRRTALELFAHVFATIPNRLQPPIWLLCHDCKYLICSCSPKVRTPFASRILIVANVLVSGFTPPVAASNSEAVINTREVNCTASFNPISEGGGLP